jgi:GNAT superfamily N-acetyltransferase
MTSLVRRARPCDADALPAIERSAAELFHLDQPLAWLADTEVADAAFHLQAIQQARVWVAEDTEGQLSGFLRAVPVDNQLHVEELSVSQHFQGQGIGRKLLSAVIAQAGEQQLCAVTLTTFRDVPFKEAHEITGALVQACEKHGIELWEASPALLAEIDPRLTADVRDSLTLEAAIAARNGWGGTAPQQVREQIVRLKTTLAAQQQWTENYQGFRL